MSAVTSGLPADVAGSAVLRLPASSLTPGAQLRFTLAVGTFLGGTATEVVDITVARAPLPAVAIDGPSTVSVSPSKLVTLAVTASYSPCGDAAAAGVVPLRVSWSLLSATPLPGDTVPGAFLPLSRRCMYPTHIPKRRCA